MSQPDLRHFILQIALKCADISNPCRPWEVSRKWSQKVCEEFYRQGDYERQLNLPVTSLCDRHTTSVPKIQAGPLPFVMFYQPLRSLCLVTVCNTKCNQCFFFFILQIIFKLYKYQKNNCRTLCHIVLRSTVFCVSDTFTKI